MAVLINEILANPAGDDKLGEFIELFNNGNEKVSLLGYKLKDESGKEFSLSGYEILGNGFLVFDYKKTKITLNNVEEKIFLIKGEEVLEKVDIGKSDSGISYSRKGEIFFETSFITPLENNVFSEKTESELKQQIISSGKLGGEKFLSFFIWAVVIGILAGALVVYIYKNLFSKLNKGNEEAYFEERGRVDEFGE